MRKQWNNYLDNIFKRQRDTFKKSEKEYYTVNAMGIWPVRLKKPEKKDLDK